MKTADEQLTPLLASSNTWRLAFDSATHAGPGRVEVVSYVVYCRSTVARCFTDAPGS